MLNAALIGRLMRQKTRRMGMPTGTLVVEYPHTITAATTLHPFMRQKSVETVIFTFRNLDGAWQRQSQDDTTDAGVVDFRTGRAVFYHVEQGVDHDALRALFAQEGAVATWQDVRVDILGVLPDDLTDSTIIRFRRQDVTG